MVRVAIAMQRVLCWRCNNAAVHCVVAVPPTVTSVVCLTKLLLVTFLPHTHPMDRHGSEVTEGLLGRVSHNTWSRDGDLTGRSHASSTSMWSLLTLSWSALGVIYGDILTSPLYVVTAIFEQSKHGIKPTHEEVIGMPAQQLYAHVCTQPPQASHPSSSGPSPRSWLSSTASSSCMPTTMATVRTQPRLHTHATPPCTDPRWHVCTVFPAAPCDQSAV